LRSFFKSQELVFFSIRRTLLEDEFLGNFSMDLQGGEERSEGLS